jgi:hypothetical protein
MPLEYLSPAYGTLTTTPPPYTLAWVFAVSFIYAGGYLLITPTLLRVLVGAYLLLLGAWFMWFLYRRRKIEWIMFPGRACGWDRGISYTRQGPDAGFCDEFTKRMVVAIRSKQSTGIEQNYRLQPSGGSGRS